MALSDGAESPPDAPENGVTEEAPDGVHPGRLVGPALGGRIHRGPQPDLAVAPSLAHAARALAPRLLLGARRERRA